LGLTAAEEPKKLGESIHIVETDRTFLDGSRIVAHLAALLDSTQFKNAPRLCEFLRFIITETLAGRSNQLKEYSIGVEVFGRRADFNPRDDSIVRVEAVKLRARLAAYYSTHTTGSITIHVPKGGYVPEFRDLRQNVPGSSKAGVIGDLCAAADLALWRRTLDGVRLARRHLSRVIELEPLDARGHLGLAETCRAALDLDLEHPATIIPTFERELTESLRLSPSSSDAHVLRSNFICATAGVGRLGIDAITRALRLDDCNARAHFWRAAVLSAQGHHVEATAEVREAIRLEPRSALFHAYVGRVLYYGGRYDEAVEKLIEVSGLDPALVVARVWLALALVELGRCEEAIATASAAVELADNAVSRCCLTYVLARARYRRDAARSLAVLVQPVRNAYVSPVWVAAICSALNAPRDAIKQLDLAVNERAYAVIWQPVDPRFEGL
jgi:tetratricopeptide (TPR) repeat protein